MSKKQSGSTRTKLATSRQTAVLDDVQIAAVLTVRYGKPYKPNTVRVMRSQAERKMRAMLANEPWVAAFFRGVL